MSRTALFDLDDTLVGRTDAFRRWWEAEARRLGVEATAIDAAVDIDGGRYRLVRDLFDTIADRLDLPVDRGRWYRDFRADYPRHVRVAPATVDGLRALRTDGFRIGIVTNGITAEQTAKIRLTGLDALVDGWAISQAEGVAKPDGRLFAVCAERIGADLAEGGWMVGDDLAADIGGGAALGLSTIWIHHGRHRDLNELQPRHIVADAADAVAIIRSGVGETA